MRRHTSRDVARMHARTHAVFLRAAAEEEEEE